MNHSMESFNDTINYNGLLISIEKRPVSFQKHQSRWFVLVFACILLIGDYFCYDNPSALQDSLQSEIGLSTSQVNWLYTIYSIPNIVLPFFGGLFMDKKGLSRICIFVFSFILCIGQAIFFYGIFIKSYFLMIVGRFIFGLGGGSLVVAENTIISRWFKDKELAFALGCTISTSITGSALNSSLSPWLNTRTGYVWLPTVLGILLCVLSCMSGLCLNYIDKIYDEREEVSKSISKNSIEEQISWKDVKSFNKLYWLILLNCALFSGSYYTFIDNANEILVKRFGYNTDTAGLMITIIFVIGIMWTPIFGKLVDVFGKRGIIMLISCILIIGAHILIAFLNDTTSPNYLILIPLVMLGFFFSTYSVVIWPSLPLVVEQKMVGKAFGMVTVFQNCMLAAAPAIVGLISDNTKSNDFGYFWTEIFLLGLVVLAFVNTIFISVFDSKSGSVLSYCQTDIKCKEEENDTF